MDKKLKTFLWILIILIVLYLIIKIKDYYYKVTNSLKDAWFNKRYCGQKKCPPTDKQLQQSLPIFIPTDKWDLDVAKYSSIVVYSLEKAAQDKVKPTYPSDLNIIKELYDNKDDPIFGAIFTDKSNSDTIWISFRGTLSSSEWVQDLAYQQESMFSTPVAEQVKLTYLKNSSGVIPSVHKGFVDVYNNFRDDLMATMNTINKKMTIVICGHSLGAAISTLVGVDLAQSGYSNIHVYNFASPRIGDQSFIDLVDNQLKLPVYRFVNISDMIPNMPPSVSPNLNNTSKPYIYVHCGKLIPFQVNRLSMLNNHLIPSYMQGLEIMSKSL